MVRRLSPGNPIREAQRLIGPAILGDQVVVARRQEILAAPSWSRLHRNERLRRLARAYAWVLSRTLNHEPAPDCAPEALHDDVLAAALIILERDGSRLASGDVVSVEPLLRRLLVRRLDQ
jgi:hypothetical protein